MTEPDEQDEPERPVITATFTLPLPPLMLPPIGEAAGGE